MHDAVKKITTPPSQTRRLGTYFTSPVAGDAERGSQRHRGATTAERDDRTKVLTD